VHLRVVSGGTRTGWQLQHGRVLIFAQLRQQHDLDEYLDVVAIVELGMN
jgi:hypothetical protein